jgi:hypothetical protein
MKRYTRMLASVLSAGALLALTAGAAAAHSHTANGQLIANGQNHYAFVMQAGMA